MLVTLPPLFSFKTVPTISISQSYRKYWAIGHLITQSMQILWFVSHGGCNMHVPIDMVIFFLIFYATSLPFQLAKIVIEKCTCKYQHLCDTPNSLLNVQMYNDLFTVLHFLHSTYLAMFVLIDCWQANTCNEGQFRRHFEESKRGGRGKMPQTGWLYKQLFCVA